MRRKYPLFAALLIAMVTLLSVPFASAQMMTLTYGMGVTGSVNAGAPFAFYSFNGNENDLATVRLVSLDPNYEPTLSITGPTGQQLAFGNYDITALGNGARLDLILPQSGSYNVQVGALNNTEGQFLIRLDGVSTVNAGSLFDGAEATPVNFTESPVQVLRVVGSPSGAQTISIQGGEVRFAASIHTDDGTLLAVFAAGMMGTAQFDLPPSDGIYTIVIRNIDESPDPVFVTLGAGIASPATGDPSAPVAPAPADPNVCTVSTAGAVNLRGGPGTSYAVLASVPGGSSYVATGQNSGWYVIEYQGITGWIAGSVTTVTGPCSALPLVAAPDSTTAPPTGPTVPPTVTNTPDPAMPTMTPPPTADPMMPTMTPTATMEMVEPTVAPTMEVIEPTATYTMEPTEEAAEHPGVVSESFTFVVQRDQTDTFANSLSWFGVNRNQVNVRISGLMQGGPNSSREASVTLQCSGTGTENVRFSRGSGPQGTALGCGQTWTSRHTNENSNWRYWVFLDGPGEVSYTLTVTSAP